MSEVVNGRVAKASGPDWGGTWTVRCAAEMGAMECRVGFAPGDGYDGL